MSEHEIVSDEFETEDETLATVLVLRCRCGGVAKIPAAEAVAGRSLDMSCGTTIELTGGSLRSVVEVQRAAKELSDTIDRLNKRRR